MRRSSPDESIAEGIGFQRARNVTTDLPADLAARLDAFAALPDEELWRLARTRMAHDDAERLAELADKWQREGLTAGELREADELVERHDWVMAAHAELLEGRGHDVSSLFGRA